MGRCHPMDSDNSAVHIARKEQTMSDLIRRADAIKALYKYNFVSKDVIEREIKAIPSVDIPHSDDWEKYSDKLWKNAYERGKADRPQGKWILFPMGYLVCSVCGSHHSNSKPCNYCDNCGARMKGADDEQTN